MHAIPSTRGALVLAWCGQETRGMLLNPSEDPVYFTLPLCRHDGWVYKVNVASRHLISLKCKNTEDVVYYGVELMPGARVFRMPYSTQDVYVAHVTPGMMISCSKGGVCQRHW